MDLLRLWPVRNLQNMKPMTRSHFSGPLTYRPLTRYQPNITNYTAADIAGVKC